MTMDAGKVVALVGAGGVFEVVALPAEDFAAMGFRSGVKQVASSDGDSLWIAGASARRGGVRFMPSRYEPHSVSFSGATSSDPFSHDVRGFALIAVNCLEAPVQSTWVGVASYR